MGRYQRSGPDDPFIDDNRTTSDVGRTSEEPRFTNANLTRLRVTGNFWRVDFRDADLRGADFTPFPAFKRQTRTSFQARAF